MNDRLEDKIRDFLAQHLDVLESGLTLFKTEYVLPNAIGAGGRIDIIARDRFGNYLVIEIKRSDQAARHALNEIFKYTGLFRRNQGLDETKVRLFVVSTDWHELLLPLSEYAETAAYAVDGFAIIASPDGTVKSATAVTLTPRPKGISLSRIQGIYLFEKREMCDQSASALGTAVRRVGIQDFVILRCDHDGSNSHVVFPHALYLCFSSPFRTLSKAEIARLKCKVEWDDELDEPEENFLCAVNADSESLCDTFEIGYPEKLTNLERTWCISVLVREGRLNQSVSLLTDEELVRLAKRVEGGSHYYYGKISSPRLKAAWRQMLNDLRLALKGNRHWETVLPVLLKKIEAETPQATVSISLYNPCNLLLSLYHIAWRSDYSRCAYLEVCTEDEVKRDFRVFASSLAWNGKPVSKSPETVVEDVYGCFEMWCANSPDFEDRALSAHNLSTPIVEFHFQNQTEPSARAVMLETGKLAFKPLANESLPTLEKYESENRDYLSALKAYLESQSVGLPGSSTNLSTD